MDVTDELIKIVNYDMECEFKGSQVTYSYAPGHCRSDNHYDYCIDGWAKIGSENICLEYGILELPETEKDYFWMHWDGLKWV